MSETKLELLKRMRVNTETLLRDLEANYNLMLGKLGSTRGQLTDIELEIKKALAEEAAK